MKIINARYLQKTVDTEDGSIQYDGVNYAISAEIDGKELVVPLSEENRHYAEIMRQVKEDGLTIADV